MELMRNIQDCGQNYDEVGFHVLEVLSQADAWNSMSDKELGAFARGARDAFYDRRAQSSGSMAAILLGTERYYEDGQRCAREYALSLLREQMRHLTHNAEDI